MWIWISSSNTEIIYFESIKDIFLWWRVAEKNCLSYFWRDEFIDNKPDFKGHPQRIPKPISDQNWSSWFQSWCWTVMQKLELKHQAFLEIFYLKESSRDFRTKTQEPDSLSSWNNWINLTFLWIPTHMQTSQYHHLIYCRSNIGNYFWHAQVRLTTPM